MRNPDGSYSDPSAPVKYIGSIQQEHALKFLSDVCRDICGPALDFGCGTGALTANVARRYSVSFTTGIDISPDRIEYASKQYASEAVQFLQGDIAMGALSRNTYRTIVSFNTLHHIPRTEMQQVFDAFYRLLTEDGAAYLLVPSRSAELHDAIDETSATPKWRRYFGDFKMSMARTYETAQYYQKMASNAGFFVCRARMVEELGNPQNFAELKQWLAGFLPQLVTLKKQVAADDFECLKEAYLSAIAEAYFQKRGVPMHAAVQVLVTYNQLVLFKSRQAQPDYKLPQPKPTAKL